jgi:hypothetical protein
MTTRDELNESFESLGRTALKIKNQRDDLLRASKEAQCSCTVRQRDSGHVFGCWMPALSEAIQKAEE